MNNAPKQYRSLPRAVTPALVVLLASVAAIFWGPQLLDTYKASRFQADTQLSAVTTRLQLTPRATEIFYATAPIVETQQQFNANCQSTERTSAILGCYYKDRIYLFNITNKELDGTLEVTAAHEMLHAAYQRLNIIERTHIDQLIKDQYAKIKGEKTIKEVMAYYKQAEPGSEINELHSIIGTTVATIDPALEQYYKRYFTDRGAIVALNTKYNMLFGEISKRADALSASIKAMEPEISSTLAAYDVDRKQLELDIESFNQRATNNGFTSAGAFNATRATLIARVDQMNVRRDVLNAKVNDYNAMIEELNALSVRVTELNKSINGAAPARSL